MEGSGRSGMLRTGARFRPDNGAGSGGGSAGGADTGQANGAGGQPDGGTPPETPTFETWYAGLDATMQGLLDGHVQGLKTALQTERQNRADLAKQIKDLTGKAEKGSDLEKQLSEAAAKIEAAERRATFAEEAIKPEVGCTNVKAAYALALAEEVFDNRGRVDWATLKALAPELFRKAGVGSADGGAGSQQAARPDMNSIIRRAAGRG